MKQEKNNRDNQLGFFDKPKNITIILNVFYGMCVILVVLDFIVHRHVYTWFEKMPTFYAAYGFVACVILVLLAKLMRVVLMREENYYGDCDDKRRCNDAKTTVSQQKEQHYVDD